MVQHRAYGTLEVRSIDTEERVIEGVANSSAEDTYGTVIEPEGAVFRLPLPFHWHHDRRSPVGEVIATEIRDGMRWVKVQIARVEDDGTEGGREVKRRVDSAWADLKNGLVRGLSIEFLPIEPKSPRAKRWTKWRWLGLAGVTIPSNMDATILAVRSAATADDASSPGLSGTPTSPGLSGTEPKPNRRRTMTVQEQIREHENSRAAKVARKEELVKLSGDEGRTLDESEGEEFDTLDQEIRSIDGHLARLNSLKRDAAAKATPVDGSSTSAATQSRGSDEPKGHTRNGVPIVRTRANTEPGIGFARYAAVMAAARGNRYEAEQEARRRFGDSADEVVAMIRVPVPAGTTQGATFAAPLVTPQNLTNEFLEMLRPATIIGRIPGLRNVPFNIAMPAQTGGGTYNWVGEGAAKPLTQAAFATVTLGFSKATGIIVLSKELVKFSNPSAERIIRDEMIAGIAAFLDTQFVTPGIAAVPNVNPASITNGVAGFAASGATEANARTDLRALMNGFVNGNFGLGGVVLLMSEGTAFTLGTMVNAVGDVAFPGLTATGGSILGVPVITSNAVGNQIIAVHAPSVLFADDGGVEIDASEQASVQMDDAPDNPSDATTVMVSLWQRNLLGLRAERFINWAVARAGAVNRITGVAYT
jgi:HK97 family phage major capsid protein